MSDLFRYTTFKFYILLFTFIMDAPRFSLFLLLKGKFARERDLDKSRKNKEEKRLVKFLYSIPISKTSRVALPSFLCDGSKTN